MLLSFEQRVMQPRRIHPQRAGEVLIRLQVIACIDEPGHMCPDQAHEPLHLLRRIGDDQDFEVAHTQVGGAAWRFKFRLGQDFLIELVIVGFAVDFGDEPDSRRPDEKVVALGGADILPASVLEHDAVELGTFEAGLVQVTLA